MSRDEDRTSPFPWAKPAAVTLAPGERLVWAGAPGFRGLALRLYRMPVVLGYGFVLTAADAIQARLLGRGAWGALDAMAPGALITLGALSVFALLAYGTARTTRYTLTDRRLVMQFGLALSATLSLPLHRIAAVRVRVRADDTGDITVLPQAGASLAYLKLWPFVRPWRFRAPEPMLREVPAPGYVGTVLSRMVAAAPRPAPAEAAPAEPPARELADA